MPQNPFGSLAPNGSLAGPLGPAPLDAGDPPGLPAGVGIRPYGSLNPYGTFTVDAGPRALRSAVLALLLSVPDLAALVGGRIAYAGSRQKDVEPRVTYVVASNDEGSDLDGPDGVFSARVRVSVWSRDSVEAETLADLVRSGLNGFRGWLGSVLVDSCEWDGDTDLPEDLADGNGTSVFQIVGDYLIEYQGGGV